MKASIGRMVIVRGTPVTTNNVDRAPAIINRVWDENKDTRNGSVMINATAFPDCQLPVSLSSIEMFDTEADANAAGGGHWCVAFWPPRVE